MDIGVNLFLFRKSLEKTLLQFLQLLGGFSWVGTGEEEFLGSKVRIIHPDEDTDGGHF